MKNYDIKLHETIEQLNGILNNANSESTIKLISNELYGYAKDLPKYRILDYDLIIDYEDLTLNISFQNYQANQQFFNNDLDLKQFDRLYIFTGLNNMKHNMKNILKVELSNAEIEILNLNLDNKKIIKAHHVISYQNFSVFMDNIVNQFKNISN
jgi:hypothetical protein